MTTIISKIILLFACSRLHTVHVVSKKIRFETQQTTSCYQVQLVQFIQ